MLFLILLIALINLIFVDFILFKILKIIKKKLNLVGDLYLSDLDLEFWK